MLVTEGMLGVMLEWLLRRRMLKQLLRKMLIIFFTLFGIIGTINLFS